MVRQACCTRDLELRYFVLAYYVVLDFAMSYIARLSTYFTSFPAVTAASVHSRDSAANAGTQRCVAAIGAWTSVKQVLFGRVRILDTLSTMFTQLMVCVPHVLPREVRMHAELIVENDVVVPSLLSKPFLLFQIGRTIYQ